MDHFSKSALEKYATCGEAYRRRYIVKEEAPTSSNLVFGIAFHETLEKYILRKAAGEKVDIFQVWCEEYASELKDHGVILFDETSPEEDEQTGLRMLTTEVIDYLDSLKPAYYILVDEEGEHSVPAVEMELNMDIPGVPVPFVGYIDFLGEDGIPVDFKTAARKWSPDKAQKELQPCFYLYGLEQIGRPSPGNWFHHAVITKGSNPSLTIFETQRSQTEIDWALRMAANAYRGIEAGVFVPNPMAWSCSPVYCEFYHNCMGG